MDRSAARWIFCLICLFGGFSIITLQLQIEPYYQRFQESIQGEMQLSMLQILNLTGIEFKRQEREGLLSKRESNIGDVSFVHLLSYQRSGSSFTGGLFSSNPDAFFIYEPIDMLYSAMYGTTPGWTVPADIFYEQTGSLRNLTVEEFTMMQWMIEKIFKCEMSSFPTSMLINSFWSSFASNMPDAQKFVMCKENHRNKSTNAGAKSCQRFLARVCPGRFGLYPNKKVLCLKLLWNNGTWWSNFSYIKQTAGNNAAAFKSYFDCLNNYKDEAVSCAKRFLDKPCSSRSIRAVKTVRTPMEVAANILNKYTNARVIHLLRDPRGAIRSRANAIWSWGNGEGKTILDHARRYCPNAVKDFKIMQQLEVKHLGRTMHIVYDGFVQDPVGTSEELYKVVGKPLPDSTRTWLHNHTVARVKQVARKIKGKVVQASVQVKNSSALASSWKLFYTFDEMLDLRTICRGFYKNIEFEWS